MHLEMNSLEKLNRNLFLMIVLISLDQMTNSILNMGSDKIIYWLRRFSFLLGFIMSNKIESQIKTAGRYIQNEIKTMARPSLSRPCLFFKTMSCFSIWSKLIQFNPISSNIWSYMSKACKLIIFFIIVHKNNNSKVTLRTFLSSKCPRSKTR